MKKSKLSKCLVTSFIAAMSLSACNEVTWNDKAIVSFTGYDGQKIDIVTESMYDEYFEESGHISAFYEKVLEVLIRNDFKRTSSILDNVKVSTSLATITEKAKANVAKDKETAETEAKNNASDWQTEWEKILTNAGVEDEEGLREKYIYDLEKDALLEAFNKVNLEELTKQFIGVTTDGSGNSRLYSNEKVNGLPYHIKHILISSEDSSKNYTRDSISSDVARKLSDTIVSLASGYYTFNGAANKWSDDTSKAQFGDVGIVSNTASSEGSLAMVAEFQLGIYVYDNIFEARDYDTSAVLEGLGLSEPTRTGDMASSAYCDSVTVTKDSPLVEVPYEVFTKLGEYYDIEGTDEDNSVKLADGNAAIYPRNILWNKYLNHHDVFIITNRGINSVNVKDIESEISNPEKMVNKYTTNLPKKMNNRTGFNKIDNDTLSSYLDSDDGNRQILCDENGQVIFGVRSQYGIHLIVIEKSINDFNIKGGTDEQYVSLAEYYTTEVPTTSTFNEKYPNYNGEYKNTYVNAIDNEEQSTLKTRAETVESKITGFDSTSEYMLYEALLAAYNSDANNPKLVFAKDVDKKIASYIESKRKAAVMNQYENMSDAWSNYVELLDAQYEARNLSTLNSKSGLIPEGCIIGFTKAYSELTDEEKALYEKGGLCYYA